MKVISIITQKGGVGKTTTSIHLGASLAKMKKKVLLVDFDGQRNLSIGYKIDEEIDYTVKNFLDGETANFEITQQNKNLFILAGDYNLESKKYSRDILKEKIKNLDVLNFDYIIIDCPPRPLTDEIGLGEIALCASDFVLSPIEAEEYSIIGLEKLIPSINRIRSTYNRKLEFLGFFFNKVNVNTVNYKKYSEIALKDAEEYFLRSYIRQDMTIEKAKTQGLTVYDIAPKSRASEDYKNLVKELIKKMK